MLPLILLNEYIIRINLFLIVFQSFHKLVKYPHPTVGKGERRKCRVHEYFLQALLSTGEWGLSCFSTANPDW